MNEQCKHNRYFCMFFFPNHQYELSLNLWQSIDCPLCTIFLWYYFFKSFKLDISLEYIMEILWSKDIHINSIHILRLKSLTFFLLWISHWKYKALKYFFYFVSNRGVIFWDYIWYFIDIYVDVWNCQLVLEFERRCFKGLRTKQSYDIGFVYDLFNKNLISIFIGFEWSFLLSDWILCWIIKLTLNYYVPQMSLNQAISWLLNQVFKNE